MPMCRQLFLLREIGVYFEHRTKHINIFRGENAELYNVEEGGTYS
jgi:hypothetical protein